MCFANAGIPVTVVETEQAVLDRGLARVADLYATSVKRGSLTADEADRRLGRIVGQVGLDGFGVREADIVVAAAGVPDIITKDMVKPGAAVLDVGVSRRDGKVAGDVAKDVAEVAGWLTPNPGGVGPMTRAMLLSNVVELAERQAQG